MIARRRGTTDRPKHLPGRPDRAPGAPRVPFALLVTALLVGGVALLLALNTASAANELRRHALGLRDDSVSNRVQLLRNEVAASAAPANIALAAGQLGMVPDGGPAFLVPDGHGGYVLRGKPEYATAAPLAEPTVPHQAPRTKPAKKKRATATPKPTRSASSSRSPKPSGTPRPSATRTRRGAHPSTSSRPKPTSTPTPTVTISGGPR